MIKIDRFFDIETQDWDQFVLGGVMSAGSREYKSFTDPLRLFYDLVETGGEVWSWNGGLFDMLWFSDLAREEGLHCNLALGGSRIVRLACEGLTMRDAIAVVPMSLQKASGVIGEPMSKETGLPCICDAECGGYCSISRDMSPHLFAELERYLKTDVSTGLDIVEAVIQEAELCDYTLSGTVGGSSYATAKKHLSLGPAVWTDSHYQIARQAYFGGRTEVFQPIATKVHAYDINSAYPAALVETSLPTGSILECEEPKAKRAYARGKEGIYLARVEVPQDMFIPPLPVRVGERVCFPVGEIQGIWTAIELREAEELGCTISIHGGLVWSRAEKVLAPFMQHVWNCRAERRDNPGLYLWHKFIANSLTGKLAEKPQKERVMINPDPDKFKVCPGRKCSPKCSDESDGCVAKGCCDRSCRRACGRWDCIDETQSIYTSPYFKIPDCGHVHWAAYLTASARIKLARQLRADGDGGKSAVYCDTDSVYATSERVDGLGDDLGEWGFDGLLMDWFALAPKMYRYESESGTTIRAKGLSQIDRADFDAFCSGLPVVRERGVETFKTAARRANDKRGLFVRKYLSRRSHADGIHYGSRVLRGDGKTYPQTIQQIEEHERRRK